MLNVAKEKSMKKKIVFTCVLLVMLAFTATSCKLPASGNPPTASSQAPIVPTTTTGVAAEPTNTSAPPTSVMVTVTSMPPTAVPPTAVPPTAIPPTPPTLPPASRIQFVAGGTSAVLNGNIDSAQTLYYVLGASGTQTMNVKVWSPNADVYLGVFGADGQVLLNSASQETLWSGILPATQDYYLSLTAADGATSYSLSVEIPPLASAPTANVTPVPGSFDPYSTYGNPTFDDPMTGENINDWVNPKTGLLPNTNYIKITETGAKFYVTGKLKGFSTWYFQWRDLEDFYFQTIFDSGACAGRDAYGMILRGPEHQAGVSYGYVVSFSCDGQFNVFRLDGANPYTIKDLVSWTKSDYILAGTNKQNVMGIQANGDSFTIFANGHQIAQVTDTKYASGRYGVFVSPDVTANYTYRVVRMTYWDLIP
jgi:hypothetical protein